MPSAIGDAGARERPGAIGEQRHVDRIFGARAGMADAARGERQRQRAQIEPLSAMR